jgi:hypothetical protein
VVTLKLILVLVMRLFVMLGVGMNALALSSPRLLLLIGA